MRRGGAAGPDHSSEWERCRRGGKRSSWESEEAREGIVRSPSRCEQSSACSSSGTPAAYGSGEKPASTTRPLTTFAPNGSVSAYLGTSHGASSPRLVGEALEASWSHLVPSRVVMSTPRRASSKACAQDATCDGIW